MEQRRFETPQQCGPPRRKAGLETPLEGRFARENKRLVFAPPFWYDFLVGVLLIGGGLVAAGTISGVAFRGGGSYGLFFGCMVLFAGAWAAFSNERMTCNLTYRTYSRLEGQGLLKRRVSGSLDELDALVLMAEELPFHARGSRVVVYRLVLHWKAQRSPLLVVERGESGLPSGAPIHHGARSILAKGQSYAQALGVKYYDNSYFHSPCPVPVA